ncbi:MAG: response regulator [Gemmatimonadota bacterium]
MTAESLLTTGQIARHCQVTQRTVHNWIQGGHLPVGRTPGGHQRVLVRDFQEFLRQHRLPVYGDDRPAPGLSKRLLVVDDDPEVLQVYARYLARLGEYEVSTATNGFNAGLEVARFRPDLVVMDLMMPYMDGLEACRWIKGDPATAHTRVLVVTGYAEEGFRSRATECGVDGWMRKPVALPELGRKVAELVGVVA